MATITPPPTRSLADDSRRVRHPLDRLRGYIRTYVSLEGAAFALIFLAVCFWVSLLLDYGTFKAVGFDWVQSLHWGFGLAVLVVLGVTLAVTLLAKVLTRLLKDFRDPSLAMVLEQRFPEQLGDRLITAVELSDPEKAASLGYSPVMVRETIHEAADRVAQVPVHQVFDWKRLLRRAGLILLLTLVAAGVAVGGFSAASYAWHGKTGLTGARELTDVVSIWFERNVLLQNTPWPRRAYLQVIEPTADPLRIGHDAPAPTVRVRAVKYVVADPSTYDGWRPLLISDLEDHPELLGTSPTQPPLSWAPRYGTDSLSLDEVELRWQRTPVRLRREGESLPARWTIAQGGEQVTWQPMRWADLTPESLGGMAVPRLSAKWDWRAQPLHAARAWGLLVTPGLPALAALPVLAMGPQPTPFITVDEVGELIEKPEFKDIKVVQLPDGTELSTFAASATGMISPALGAGGAFTGMGLLATVTEVNLSSDVRHVLAHLERVSSMRTLLEDLDRRVEDPAMSRTMRRLVLPDTVTLSYTVKNTTYSIAMTRGSENEYSDQMKNLKVGSETYRFRAEDYTTPSRAVDVLPPPAVVTLVCLERHPAYLYYRPENAAEALRLVGRRQPMEEIDIAGLGSDVSRVEVPAGSDITLEVVVNKPVSSVEIQPARGAMPVAPASMKHAGEQITLVFKDVRHELKFTLAFKDADGVEGSRLIQVKAREDSPPELLDVRPDEVIRKTKEGYMVTTRARIPFQGVLQDDRGLAEVRYAYTLSVVESGLRVSPETLALFATSTLQGALAPQGLGAAVLYLASLRQAANETAAAAGQVAVRYSDGLPAFQRQVAETRDEILPWARIEQLLAATQASPYRQLLSTYTLKPDVWTQAMLDPVGNDFSVNKLGLTVTGERQVQPRYRMQLWMEAIDTDLESVRERDGTPRPHVSPSKERFSFLIVSENELLSQIGDEEEELRARLEEMVNESGKYWTSSPLIQLEAELIKEHLDLAASDLKPEYLSPMAGRVQKVQETLDKGKLYTLEIVEVYRRLIREMQVNVINPGFITKVQNDIVTPLEQIEDELFPAAIRAVDDFRKDLEAGKSKTGSDFLPAVQRATASGEKARAEVRTLKVAFDRVLQSMQKLTDINKLVKMLRQIEEKEQEQFDTIRKIKEDLERELLEGALKGLNP